MTSEYHKSKRMSVSKIKCLANDPVEFRMRYVDDPPTLGQTSSDALVYGSALHCLFLEPHLFDQDFAVAPKMDRRTKAGKEEHEQFMSQLNGRTMIDMDTYGEVIEAVQQLRAHSWISTMMGATTQEWIERAIEFELHGIEFQCKPDVVIPAAKLILDLKTVSDARPHKFRYQVSDFGYHIQAATYQQAIYHLTGEWYRFVFIAIETQTPSTAGMPFKIALYELDHASIERGRIEMSSLIEDYIERKKSGDWSIPYCNDIVSLQIPSIPFGYRKEQ